MSYIEVSNLQKNFIVKKKHEKGKLLREKEIVNALKGVSFSVEKGELVGYIGPNGICSDDSSFPSGNEALPIYRKLSIQDLYT